MAPGVRSASGVDPGSPRGALGAGRRDRPRGHGLALHQAPPEAERGLAAGAAAGPDLGRPPAAARGPGLGAGDPRSTRLTSLWHRVAIGEIDRLASAPIRRARSRPP